MGLFSRKSRSSGSRLADAVAADAAEAFARFVADRGDDSIVALALCSVDDAVTPYIMGATLDDIGPIKDTEDTWRADPADWSWSDGGNKYRCDAIIGEMLEHQPDSFEEHGRDIFEGIVEGLKKFDASGCFKGKLPREQMLLVLWINDPADHNSKAVMKWVAQLNPNPVSVGSTLSIPTESRSWRTSRRRCNQRCVRRGGGNLQLEVVPHQTERPPPSSPIEDTPALKAGVN
jgi:hypothetical protein